MPSIRPSSSILHFPAPLRALLYARQSSTSSTTAHLPRVAQPSLWTSLIPKAWRRDPNALPKPSQRGQKWRDFFTNPATPVLLLALLVGSQAIQTLTLKNETIAYTRKTEAKLTLLRGVIERVQRGEDVDVEGVLGTGEPQQEEEWFDVIKEIEEEERIWSRKRRRAAKKKAEEEEGRVVEENKGGLLERDVKVTGREQRPAKPMFV